ncbi:hypothetical protein [Pseudonocardia sp. TMWB2A]|uniref:hypothetical protein n=1 Tax=Pseudonocardia sp. TMWB2A TaxID=687430 RepID=UPI00307FCEDA
MRSVREETSIAMLSVVADLSDELAKSLDQQAAVWQIRGEYDRGYVAALEGTADVLRGRSRRAAERVGELKARTE